VKREKNSSRLFCVSNKENESDRQQPRPSNREGDGPAAAPRPRSKPSIFESVELLAQPANTTPVLTSGLQRSSTGSAFSSVVSGSSSWTMFGDPIVSVNTNLPSAAVYPTDCHLYAPLTQMKGQGFLTNPISQPSYVVPSFDHSVNALFPFSTATQTSPAIPSDSRSAPTTAVNPRHPPATGMPSLHQVSRRFMLISIRA